MTSATVIEFPRYLEPVTQDTFLDGSGDPEPSQPVSERYWAPSRQRDRENGRGALAPAARSCDDAAFTRSLAVLSDALEAKDSYTAAHAREVADLSERVGARLGMSPDELRTLRYGALLHDVGKIAIPTEILRKPGPLSTEEFEEIKRHTVIGAEKLARIPFFADVHPLVRSSHERWDGAGYPDGLCGEDIPLGARIIFACDALHAMTSDRPYRRAMSHEAALAELRANAGTQFDPQVVDALHSAQGEPAARALHLVP